MYRNQ